MHVTRLNPHSSTVGTRSTTRQWSESHPRVAQTAEPDYIHWYRCVDSFRGKVGRPTGSRQVPAWLFGFELSFCLLDRLFLLPTDLGIV